MDALGAGAAGVYPVEAATAGLVAAEARAAPCVRRTAIGLPPGIACVLTIIAARIIIVGAIDVAAIIATAIVTAIARAIAPLTIPVPVSITAFGVVIAEPGANLFAGPFEETAVLIFAMASATVARTAFAVPPPILGAIVVTISIVAALIGHENSPSFPRVRMLRRRRCPRLRSDHETKEERLPFRAQGQPVAVRRRNDRRVTKRPQTS